MSAETKINSLRGIASRERSEEFEVSQTFTDIETTILRKLVQVLREGINNDCFAEGKDVQETGDEHAADKGKLSDLDKQERLRNRISTFKPENTIMLQELCRRHSPLVQHVQSLLDTLGGGNRTARTLGEMQKGLDALSQSCWSIDKGTYDILPNDCVKNLRAVCAIIDEMIEAFQEFGVFNTEFFDALGAVKESTKDIATRIDGEYGSDLDYPATIDEYLDHVVGPLARNLKRYIEVLTAVSEKEIPAIRQSQDIVSQRYVNLTTIATFLSSVTATTLQISASAPASLLTTVTNTFWFVSLVFSAASAVYSLLEMTWRRSPIRRSDQSLPALAHAWLRNGPVFALIVALMTFSIGLCLLAFLVADQQGGVAPAAVPTGFAGAHAQAIFFLSISYLFESWRTRHTKRWETFQSSPAFRRATLAFIKIRSLHEKAKNSVHRKIHYGTRIKSHFTFLGHVFARLFQRCNGTPASDVGIHRDDELELGFQPSIDSQAALDFISERTRRSITEDVRESATKSSKRTSSLSKRHGRPEDLIQFSTDCALLASAFGNTVTIYRVDESFKVFSTFVIPDAGAVRQVSWHPDAGVGWDDRLKEGYLLVRSLKHAYIYNLDQPDRPRVYRLMTLDSVTAPIRWICEEDNGANGFSCLMGKSLKIFALGSNDDSFNGCTTKENNSFLEIASHDLSDLKDPRLIFDAAFYGKDEIVCLARTRGEELDILIIDKCTMSIRKTLLGDPFISGRASLSVSQKSKRSGKAFIHREGMTEIFELEANSSPVLMKTRAAGHFGKDNCMVYSAKGGKVLIYHGPPFSLLHKISTPSPRAEVRDFRSFALGHNPAFAFPYLFAFGNQDGSVKVWSIQSNRDLDVCESAEVFEVHDRLDSDLDSVVRTGKFLTLSPTVELEPPHSTREEANELHE